MSMKTDAKSIDEYLATLADDRREALETVRKVILDNLPEGYEEAWQYGMISYIVPFDTFPDTYNKKPLAYLSLASQKNHMALYMNNIYSDPELEQWFTDAYKEAGKKLDMGKSCVRFKKLENLPLDVIGEAVAHTPVDQFIEIYKHAKKTSKKPKKT